MPVSSQETLTASVVTTVSLDAPGPVEVLHLNGTGIVEFIVNEGATNPTVGGDDQWVVAPVIGASKVVRGSGSGTTVVKLISNDAAMVQVTAAGT
jgi:hypothetical protein